MSKITTPAGQIFKAWRDCMAVYVWGATEIRWPVRLGETVDSSITYSLGNGTIVDAPLARIEAK